MPEAHIERISDAGLYRGRASGFAEQASPFMRRNEADSDRLARPRARRRRPHRGPELSRARAKRKSAAGFKVGDEVFHQKFGYGKIRAVEGDKLEIAFSTGIKKVLDSFVEPV